MVKIEPMRPAASLYQARVLRGQPPKVTGLLVLLSSWVIADPLHVFVFSANLRGFLLPHPPISHLSVKVSIWSAKHFSTGSGSSVTVPVSGRCRGMVRACAVAMDTGS